MNVKDLRLHVVLQYCFVKPVIQDLHSSETLVVWRSLGEGRLNTERPTTIFSIMHREKMLFGSGQICSGDCLNSLLLIAQKVLIPVPAFAVYFVSFVQRSQLLFANNEVFLLETQVAFFRCRRVSLGFT